MAEPEFDTSSGKDVREKTSDVRLAEEKFAFDLDVVLETTRGRSMLWFMLNNHLEGAGAFNDPFVRGDEHFTAYLCGLQAQAKNLMTYFISEPKRLSLYTKMVEENTT